MINVRLAEVALEELAQEPAQLHGQRTVQAPLAPKGGDGGRGGRVSRALTAPGRPARHA